MERRASKKNNKAKTNKDKTNQEVKLNSKEIVKRLKERYPDAKCSLDFETPFEMVVAVMLSAQCTDERVNKTTPDIFKK